jgi:hypothetical protein
MRTGRIRLTVPLLDDVIQIGVAGTLTTGTIEVDKTPSTIAVRRTDGKPLQAEISHAGEGQGAVGRAVFQTPVDTLTLLRVPFVYDSGLWVVTRGVRVRRRSELIQLVQTIVAFGAAKQHGEATSSQLVKASARRS